MRHRVCIRKIPVCFGSPYIILYTFYCLQEQRAWSRGANSDTSIRLYKKENPTNSLISGGGRGGSERGRGRGRGFFDRHRGPPDDEDAIGRREEGGRPFGRGNYSYS